MAAKKKIKLGQAVRAKAGKNKAYGRALDKLPHGSAARNKMAGKA